MQAFSNPENLSAELVSRAHAYKSKAKLLYKDALVRRYLQVPERMTLTVTTESVGSSWT